MAGADDAVTGPLGSSVKLPLAIVRKIDALCDDYGEALLRGSSVAPDDYLPQIPAPYRGALLDALVGVELDYWESHGADDPQAVVLARHPALEAKILATSHYATIADLSAGSLGRGRSVPEESSQQGLSIRCPHCRQRFAVDAETQLDDVVCSRCGSTIPLLDEQDRTDVVAPERTLGHFRLIEQIGVGSFGAVWRARDLELDRDVALKIPRKGQLDAEERRLFFREARAAAQLNHPHIVGVHEVGFDEETLFIVGDLIRGQTLSARLKEGALPVAEAVGLCATVAGALEHAHQQGVVHRDLKPQNVMLDAEGAAHIMDFGLAKRVTGDATMTLQGRLVGTPAYMAPEQANFEATPVDARSDVYGLGVILFQLLTGQLPFRGSTPAILQQVVSIDAPDPRSLKPSVPRDLAAICTKCLRKEPAARYQSAAELEEDLLRYLRGEPVAARVLSPLERYWRRGLGRHRQVDLRLAGAGLLVALLVGLGSYIWIRRLDEQARDASRRAATQAASLASLEYVNQITEAYTAYEKGWNGQTQRMLAAAKQRFFADEPPDFAWRLLNQLSRPPEPQLLGVHPGGANELEVFPDGRRMASVGGDGLVRIWHIEARQLLKSYDFGEALPEMDLATGGMHAVAVSPDGRYLAAGADVVGLVDLEKDDEIRPLFHADYNVEALQFAPDSQRLAATVRYEEIVLLDVHGAILKRLESYTRGNALEYLPQHKWWVGTHAVRPKAESVFLALNDDFSPVDTADSRLPVSLVYPRFIRSAPSGRWLVIGSSSLHHLKIVDTTGESPSLLTPEYRDRPSDAAWAPDSRTLAIGYDNGFLKCHRVEQLPGGEYVLSQDATTFVASDTNLRSVRFVDRETVATAAADGKILLWKPFERSGRTPVKTASMSPRSARFSPAGDLLAAVSNSGNIVEVYDGYEGNPIAELQVTSPEHCVWSADGQSLLCLTSHSNQLTFYDWKLNLKRRIEASQLIHHVACSPVDGYFATVDQDEAIVYSLESATPVERSPLEETGRQVVFSPDGRSLAYGGADPLLSISRIGAFEDALRLPSSSSVESLAWSPDGSVLASGHVDGVIRLWNVADGKLLKELVGHRAFVTMLHFCQDNNTLISSCGVDGTRVWLTDWGRCVGLIPNVLRDVSADDRQVVISYGPNVASRIYLETLAP